MDNVEYVTLRELQLTELDILKKFARFCDKNDLRYTLLGGTLLGAVRHKGFIPWDDDIDIGMPRPDYRRFLDLVKKEKIAPELSVVSGDDDEAFSLPFAKVFNDNIMIMEECIDHQGTGNCVWIDIEPYDGLGNDPENAKKLFSKATRLQKALGRASSIPWKRRVGEYGISGFLKCLFRSLFRIRGYKYYKRKLIELANAYSYESSKYIAVVVSGYYGEGEILEKDRFEKYTKKIFEEAEYSVMGSWQEYLTGIYGDYMQLPPEDKRRGAHNVRVKRKEGVNL